MLRPITQLFHVAYNGDSDDMKLPVLSPHDKIEIYIVFYRAAWNADAVLR